MKKDYLIAEERKAVKLFSDRLRKLLKDNLVHIKLFGSKIRGDFTKDSDIDLVIVMREKNYIIREQIYDILLDVELEFNAHISLKIFTSDEIEKNKQLGSPFIDNLEREGILL